MSKQLQENTFCKNQFWNTHLHYSFVCSAVICSWHCIRCNLHRYTWNRVQVLFFWKACFKSPINMFFCLKFGNILSEWHIYYAFCTVYSKSFILMYQVIPYISKLPSIRDCSGILLWLFDVKSIQGSFYSIVFFSSILIGHLRLIIVIVTARVLKIKK